MEQAQILGFLISGDNVDRQFETHRKKTRLICVAINFWCQLAIIAEGDEPPRPRPCQGSSTTVSPTL